MTTLSTLAEIEAALNAGTLQAQGPASRGAKWYDIRRNGATQRWKREPMRASIPCKAGLRECFRIEVGADGALETEFIGRLRVRPDGFDYRKRA